MKFLIENFEILIKLNRFSTHRFFSSLSSTNAVNKPEDNKVLRSVSGKLSLVSEDSNGYPFTDILHNSLPFQNTSNHNILPKSSSTPSQTDLQNCDIDSYKLDKNNNSQPVPLEETIDIETFKDYLLIPPIGIKSYFSSRPEKFHFGTHILFKEYVPGSLLAHNYPLKTLPLNYSRRINPDIYVNTYSADERNFALVGGQRIRLSLNPGLKVQNSYPLLHKVSGNTTLLFTFSGDLPNSQYKSIQSWFTQLNLNNKNVKIITVFYYSLTINYNLLIIISVVTSLHVFKTTQLLNSRQNVLMSRVYKRYLETVARIIVEESTFMSVVGKLNSESVISLHQYRPQLPSVVLIDSKGYIRWHCVGLPTYEAIAILLNSIQDLTK
uniref:Uncharacterized protein n=1 Tax=Theileria annulata TaxID=5874 RepID=A0A3B0NBV3_THEAN